MPSYWLPESDSPQHVTDADAARQQREADSCVRMVAKGMLLGLCGVPWVVWFAVAWAREDDILVRRMAAFVARLAGW
jgi:hypothetical protein